jgi:amino acid adenylation domain-containing protein/FkbH-like protein
MVNDIRVKSFGSHQNNFNKILISGSFIIEPLHETLDFWVQEIPLKCEIKFSPYNQIFQTLSMSEGHKDAIFILIRDKDLFHSAGEENFHLFIQYLRSACQSTSSHIFVIHCPDRTANSWGEYLKKEIHSIPGVYYIDLQDWLDRYHVSDFFDPNTEHSAHIPYKPAVYTVLGTIIARMIYTIQSPIIKLIGVDCDNTLWSGVVAEEKISIHKEFQHWLLDLHRKGLVIALFSKNEIEDVHAVFEKNSDMVLQKESVTAWYVNWASKGGNLSHLIRTLNIGSDSVLFLDDNPLECATVSAVLPEVAVVQFEPSIFHHIWDMPIYYKGTAEDSERSNMYKQHLQREDLKQTSKSFSEFIHSLDLRVQINPIRPEEVERVAQLTQRTNQFNASMRRRKSGQIEEFLEEKGNSIYVLHAQDRFGDYGLVGTIFLEDRENSLLVDSYLLSCRVLGRGIEHQMASFIGKLAHGNSVVISYSETKRNRPIKIFLDSLNPSRFNEESYFFESETLAQAVFEPTQLLFSEPLVPDIKTAQPTAINRSNLAKLTTSLKTAEEIRSKMRKNSSAHLDKPKNALEILVVKCMSEVLNIDCIGVKDHFFSLGGDSFDAAVLASRLEEATNKAIDITHIFDDPTAEALSLVIQDLPHVSKLEVKNNSEEIPATSEQLAIWHGMRTAPQPSVYQIPLAYHIQGNLDIERLNFSLNTLRNRYDALQVSFKFRQNALIQTKDEYHSYKLESVGPLKWKFDVMFHHIICDEQSLAIFMQELSDLYNNPSHVFPPVGSYSQYSLNQENRIPYHTLEFWKKELPQSTLPMSPDRKAGYHNIPLAPHLREKILDFIKEHDVTPFALILTVFSVAFRLFSQEDQFLIGIPFSTRKSEKIFGLFVNLLPVNFSFQDEMKFKDLLMSCKKKVSQIFNHRFTPFYRIQEELGSSIHLNVIFSWNRRIGQTPRLNEVEVTRLKALSTFTEFDISFIVEEEEDNYAITIQYASSTYEDWQIKTLGKNFIAVLEKILTQPDLFIDKLTPSFNNEKSKAHANEQKTLIEMIESAAPQLTAIETEELSWTYQTLNEKANQLAHGFIIRGMGSNKGAVVCLEDPIEQIIAALAILKTGGYFIPLDCNDPIEHRKGIIEDVKPFLVIDQISFGPLDNLPKTNPEIAISPNDIAYIIYTSGSTGRPKGVIIEHEGLSHRAIQARHLLNISSSSRILSQASPSFDMHIFEWGFALANGAALCPYRSGINRLWNFMNKMQVSHAILTPGVLSLLPNVSSTHLKYVLVAGEVTPQNLMERWSHQATIVNGYGPTECTIFTHMHVFNRSQSARIIGRSIPGIECSVVDDRGKLVHEGGIGELYIGGIGITRGYVGRETLTDRQFKTGDLVRILPDGLLEYIGRKDDLVKVNGCRVDLHLIENKIMTIPNISEAAVVPIQMNEDKSVLACYYSGNLDHSKTLRKHLRTLVPLYMIPTQYFHMETLPRLLNGKLDREKLKSIKKTNRTDTTSNLSALENELGIIWYKLLGENPRDKEDDFFQMGGDSLRSVQLIIEIEKRWGIEILMPELQEHSSLAELAQILESRQTNQEKQTILPIQTCGNRIPLFLIHPSIGLAECYRPLSDHLQGQPLYGIQNPFIIHRTTRFSTLSEMAIHYSEEIKKAHPVGPYIIGGWSFGGVVALEIAVILKALGESVDRVILLDSYAPEVKLEEFPLLVNSEDLLLESQHNSNLLQRHPPSSYDGMVHLIRASSSTLSNNGWHFLRNLSISEIALAHHEMFDLKHISKMANALECVLCRQ